MAYLNRTQVCAHLAQHAGITPDQADLAVASIENLLDLIITDTAYTSVRLRHGRFKASRRAARPARNMQTGERVLIPERTTITYKPDIQSPAIYSQEPSWHP